MYRISAINGDTDSEDEDEPQVTKEAEVLCRNCNAIERINITKQTIFHLEKT